MKRYTKNPVGAHYGLGALAAAARHRGGDGASTRSACWPASAGTAPATYADWKALFGAGVVPPRDDAVPGGAALSRVGRHARHLMDYVKPDGLRLALEVSRWSSCWSATSSGRSRSCGDAGDEPFRCASSTRSIVGAGGSGMRASLQLAEAGSRWRCCPRCSRRARTRSPRRAASAPRSATWARTTGTGTCTTPSRARDYLGDQDAIEFMCREAPRSGVRARALRHAVRPQRRRHDLPAPVRRPHGELRREAGAARLRRGRPHRPRDAAHALPAQRARATRSSSSSGWRST